MIGVNWINRDKLWLKYLYFAGYWIVSLHHYAFFYILNIRKNITLNVVIVYIQKSNNISSKILKNHSMIPQNIYHSLIMYHYNINRN